MAQNFKIDQAATFAGVVFIQCAPKLEMGTEKQAFTKAGERKWEVQVLGGFHNAFRGSVDNEVLKIGVTGEKNPCESLSPYSPVQLVGFEVGVMEKTKKNPTTGEERVIGVTVWYRAQEVRPLSATGSNSGSRGKSSPDAAAA